jgi:hypothetical protein
MPNATVRANARALPKSDRAAIARAVMSAPGNPLNQATLDLTRAVDELHDIRSLIGVTP